MLGYDSEPYRYGSFASSYGHASDRYGGDRYSMRTTSSTSQFYPAGGLSYSRSPSLDLGGRSYGTYGRSAAVAYGASTRSRQLQTGGGYTSDFALRRAFERPSYDTPGEQRRQLPATPNVQPYRPLASRNRTAYDSSQGYDYGNRSMSQSHTISGSNSGSWHHARSLSVDRFGSTSEQQTKRRQLKTLDSINGYESDQASHDEDLSDRGSSNYRSSTRTSLGKDGSSLCVTGRSLHSREASEDSGYYSNGTLRRQTHYAQHAYSVNRSTYETSGGVWRESLDPEQPANTAALLDSPNDAYRHSLGLPAHPLAGVGHSGRVVGVRRIARGDKETGAREGQGEESVGAKKPPRPHSPTGRTAATAASSDSPSSSSISSDMNSSGVASGTGTLSRRVRFHAEEMGSSDGQPKLAQGRARVSHAQVAVNGTDAVAVAEHKPTRGILRSGSPIDQAHMNGSTEGDNSTEKETKLDAAYRRAAATVGITNGAEAICERTGKMAIGDARDGPVLGIIGLRNIGNTCYMNSIIQCLSHTKPLRPYCLKEKCFSDINNNTPLKGALMKSFCEMIDKLWSSTPEGSFTPRDFKAQLEKYEPRFKGYSQQDCQEFLRFCLQGLHEEVNKAPKRPPNAKPLPEVDHTLPEKEIAREAWRRYLLTDESRIVDIFVGQLKSQLQCAVCGHKSVTFDPFWDLSLPIPRGAAQGVSLTKCLNAFFEEETLDGDEVPMCEKCKCRRKSTRTLYIHKLPKILVLHLKRFSGERYKSRLSTKVEFPLKRLDVSNFSDPNCESHLNHIRA